MISYSNLQNTKIENFSPKFSPVYSVEEQAIFGYQIKEHIFQSKDFNEKDSQYFQNKFTKTNGLSLFIAIPANELIIDIENSIGLDSLFKKSFIEKGIDAEKVFLLIGNTVKRQQLDSLVTAVEFTKELGFNIVLDAFGEEAFSVEVLAALRPTIIRLNFSHLVNSLNPHEIKSKLAYLSNVSLNTGCAIYIEGVSNEDQLYTALDSGAGFLQGSLFGEEYTQNLTNNEDQKNITNYFKSFHIKKRKSIAEEIAFEAKLLSSLNASNIIVKEINKTVILDAQSIFKLSTAIKRIYLTEWDGTQVSAYYERNGENGFKENKASVEKNWSYLPYFYKHVKRAFRDQNQWNISEPYWDQTLNEKLIVFSKIINGKLSIFIDVALY
jgi:EAL domain-containing protein (putative c-di-GMP-specific phosphodiesterase class I)